MQRVKLLDPAGTLQDNRRSPYEPEEKGSREASEGEGQHFHGRPGLNGVPAMIWIIVLSSFNVFLTEVVVRGRMSVALSEVQNPHYRACIDIDTCQYGVLEP